MRLNFSPPPRSPYGGPACLYPLFPFSQGQCLSCRRQRDISPPLFFRTESSATAPPTVSSLLAGWRRGRQSNHRFSPAPFPPLFRGHDSIVLVKARHPGRAPFFPLFFCCSRTWGPSMVHASLSFLFFFPLPREQLKHRPLFLPLASAATCPPRRIFVLPPSFFECSFAGEIFACFVFFPLFFSRLTLARPMPRALLNPPPSPPQCWNPMMRDELHRRFLLSQNDEERRFLPPPLPFLSGLDELEIFFFFRGYGTRKEESFPLSLL